MVFALRRPTLLRRLSLFQPLSNMLESRTKPFQVLSASGSDRRNAYEQAGSL